MKTYSAKPGEVQRRWYVVDATDQALGRLATRIASVLRGKHKPEYTPHVDVGDFVVVVNCEKIALTGDKLASKWYRHHSGYPGGLKELWYGKLLEKHPERAIQKAVWGMLPKTTLGRQQMKKLKVYAGPEHPHSAQKPEPLPGATMTAEAGSKEAEHRAVPAPSKASRQDTAGTEEEAPVRTDEQQAPAPVVEPAEAAGESVPETTEEGKEA